MNRDFFISFILFIVIASFCLIRFETIDFSYISNGRNVWFQSDSRRYFRAIDDRKFDHSRSNVHPAFSSIGYLAVKPFTMVGLEKEAVVKIFYSFLGGLWVLMIFHISRKVLDVLDSTLLCFFCFSTATFQFSHFLIETFLLGSISLLVAFNLGFSKSKASINLKKYKGVLVIFISGCITITNSMLGLIILKNNLSLKEILRTLLLSSCIFLLLSLFQNLIFNESLFIFNLLGEREWVLHDMSGSFFDKLLVFFSYSISLPKTLFLDNPQEKFFPMISVQKLGFAGLLNFSGLVSFFFLSLVTISFFKACRLKEDKFIRTILIFLGFQLGLHLLYGDETFLYSFHWIPFFALLMIPLFQKNSSLSLRVSFLIFGVLNLIQNNMVFWETLARLDRYSL